MRQEEIRHKLEQQQWLLGFYKVTADQRKQINKHLKKVCYGLQKETEIQF